MKTYSVKNKNLVGQYAVTRPVPRKPGMFSTAFFQSYPEAVEAAKRIGIIKICVLAEGNGTKKNPLRIVAE